MSGTDKTKTGLDLTGPAVILVEPQLGENIGMAARAMGNFGLTRLRIVNPRDGWPNVAAQRAAAGADHILEQRRAVRHRRAGGRRLTCCSPPPRAPTIRPSRWSAPEAAAREIVAHVGSGGGAGILFGRERAGLTTRRWRSPTGSSPSRSIRALPRSTWRRRCC